MILSVAVETNGARALEVGTRLINAEFWHRAETVETTKTQLLYPLNYRDRREKPALLKTTEAIATLRAAANLAPTSEAITLPVHNSNNVSLATANKDFRTRDIVWGYNLPSDVTKSKIFILGGGFKVYTYVVDNTIEEIVALVTVVSVALSTAAEAPVTTDFEITITFSEEVTGFIAADLGVVNGSVNGAVVTTDNITFTATITPTADGDVTISLDAAKAQDLQGNDNTAAPDNIVIEADVP